MEIVLSKNNVEIDFVQHPIKVGNNLDPNFINVKKSNINLDIFKNEININLSGQIIMNQLKFEWVDPPLTRNSPGIPGQASFSDDYFYICVAQDLWARTILTKGF